MAIGPGTVTGAAGNAKFRAYLTRWQENFKTKTLVEAQRRFAMEYWKRVLRYSPVRSGRFRGHWVMSIGFRSTALTGIRYRGNFGSPMSAAEQSRALAALVNLRAGQRIFLSNNLPYAELIENGWSGMAPAGVAARALAETKALRISNKVLP